MGLKALEYIRQRLLLMGSQALLGRRRQDGWSLEVEGIPVDVRGKQVTQTDPRHRDLLVLLEHPQRVDLSVLGTFAEYREFRAIRHEKQEDAGSLVVSTDVSPSEAIGTLVEDSNAALAADLLERVLAQPPVFLEALALRLLAAMGYGAESLFSNTPASRGTQVLTA